VPGGLNWNPGADDWRSLLSEIRQLRDGYMIWQAQNYETPPGPPNELVEAEKKRDDGVKQLQDLFVEFNRIEQAIRNHKGPFGDNAEVPLPPPRFDLSAMLQGMNKELVAIDQQLNSLAGQAQKDVQQAETFLTEPFESADARQKAWTNFINQIDFPGTWLRGSGRSQWDRQEGRGFETNARFFSLHNQEQNSPEGQQVVSSLNKIGLGLSQLSPQLDQARQRIFDIGLEINQVDFDQLFASITQQVPGLGTELSELGDLAELDADMAQDFIDNRTTYINIQRDWSELMTTLDITSTWLPGTGGEWDQSEPRLRYFLDEFQLVPQDAKETSNGKVAGSVLKTAAQLANDGLSRIRRANQLILDIEVNEVSEGKDLSNSDEKEMHEDYFEVMRLDKLPPPPPINWREQKGFSTTQIEKFVNVSGKGETIQEIVEMVAMDDIAAKLANQHDFKKKAEDYDKLVKALEERNMDEVSALADDLLKSISAAIEKFENHVDARRTNLITAINGLQGLAVDSQEAANLFARIQPTIGRCSRWTICQHTDCCWK